MLDSEQHFSSQGLTLRDAIFQAGRRRLRPIVMTAMATIFGMLPLAVAVGSGAQMLQPHAIAVIGGVATSMFLSLLVTPVLYSLARAWYRDKSNQLSDPSLGHANEPQINNENEMRQQDAL